MDLESFEILEQKIGKILQKVEALKEEKGELQERYNDLQSRYTQISRELEETREERDSMKSNQRDKEQEALIRSKITALLEKIESV
ncbi:cell division protein ZapB [bacterium]|nr:cell division protein ZapB [bacterium]MBU1636892.1 cell division protein ZapB [bacterium]MBU1921142.1 cell division protein ZapB [bacterium]RQV98347.1 MAG: cell division protein ZapB [bacterium]